MTLWNLVAPGYPPIPLNEGGYSAEAQALFARFTTPPTAARKTLINDLIVSLKSAGVWAKLDALYLMAAANAQAAQRNWIADAYNLTPTNAPTFEADRGYTGSGASQYLDTGFNPSTAGGKYAQNSATIGAWSRTDLDANTALIGLNGSVASFLVPRTGGNLSYRINDGTSSATAVSNSVGLFAISRADGSTKRPYQNGAALTTAAVASSSLANASFILLGGAATFTTRQVASGFIGSNLTDAEHLALYNAMNTYLTAVGA